MNANRTSPNFDQLLAAWNSHHALQRSGASFRDLAASRRRLDRIRLGLS